MLHSENHTSISSSHPLSLREFARAVEYRRVAEARSANPFIEQVSDAGPLPTANPIRQEGQRFFESTFPQQSCVGVVVFF